MAAFVLQWQYWIVAIRLQDPQSQRYLLFGPLRETFAGLWSGRMPQVWCLRILELPLDIPQSIKPARGGSIANFPAWGEQEPPWRCGGKTLLGDLLRASSLILLKFSRKKFSERKNVLGFTIPQRLERFTSVTHLELKTRDIYLKMWKTQFVAIVTGTCSVRLLSHYWHCQD